MRLLKTHPILGLLNSYMVDSPQPASISYMWNFGSLLGACLIIQIITGITLAILFLCCLTKAYYMLKPSYFTVPIGNNLCLEQSAGLYP